MNVSQRRPRRLKEGDDYVLFRHFSNLKKLGRGNFASVYQVCRLADGRDYALKHIDIGALPPGEYEDVVNEIRLVAAVQHPNLITYYEAWVERGQLFVVTELADGGDLGTLLGKLERRREGLQETQVWRFFLQLAAGLQYLHHNRVLHRDMKPENVLLSEGGMLKIADLGISQVLDHVFTKVLMGTPQYVAPEAWRGKPYSYSADVWALGCILHELCTRRPLFLPRGRPSDKEICTRVLEGRVTPISRKYSPDLWDLIKRLLAKNPAERPTMDEVMQMEMVQARMHLLPSELRASLQPSYHGRAVLPRLFRISLQPGKWGELNSVLPPATYAVGQGVAESLLPTAPRMRPSSSCPDLAHGMHSMHSGDCPADLSVLVPPGGGPEGGAAQAFVQSEAPSVGLAQVLRQEGQTGQQQGGGGEVASSSSSSSGGVSGLFRFSTAYPAAAAWAAGEGLRRASICAVPRAAAPAAPLLPPPSTPPPPPQQQASALPALDSEAAARQAAAAGAAGAAGPTAAAGAHDGRAPVEQTDGRAAAGLAAHGQGQGQGQGEQQPAGWPARDGACGPASQQQGPPLRRCRSLSELLRCRPRFEGAVSRSHWARLWGFDPTPLEFGDGPKGQGACGARQRGGGCVGQTLAEYAASSYGGTASYAGSLHGGGSFYEASYHGGRRGGGGGGNSSYGGSYAGSYQGSYHGGGFYYDSSYHGSRGGSSYGGSYHGGGAYYHAEPSMRGGVAAGGAFAAARAAAAAAGKKAEPPEQQQQQQRQQQQGIGGGGGWVKGKGGGKGATAQQQQQQQQQQQKRRGEKKTGGGFKAKLKRLLFGKDGS